MYPLLKKASANCSRKTRLSSMTSRIGNLSLSFRCITFIFVSSRFFMFSSAMVFQLKTFTARDTFCFSKFVRYMVAYVNLFCLIDDFCSSSKIYLWNRILQNRVGMGCRAWTFISCMILFSLFLILFCLPIQKQMQRHCDTNDRLMIGEGWKDLVYKGLAAASNVFPDSD